MTRTCRRRSRQARWSCPCFGCGVETIPATGEQEYYSVRDEIWAATELPFTFGYYLCIGCLEQRIGRRLTRADFSDAPINAPDDDVWSLRTARLRDRLSSS